MKEFSVFVITAAACVFFLTGCGAASDSTSSVEPDAPHTESTAQPTATPIIRLWKNPFLTLRRQITPGLWWR